MWRIFQGMFRFFLPKVVIEGDPLPREGPYLVVSNHVGPVGPVWLLSFWPSRLYPWIVSEMLSFKQAPRYLFEDFVGKHLRLSSWVGRGVAFLLALVVVPFLKGLGCIPVYRQSRHIQKTFEKSLELLVRGERVVVFAEDASQEAEDGIAPFRHGFLKLVALYGKKTGKPLQIIPVAVCEKTKKIRVGNPVFVCEEAFSLEKRKACGYQLEKAVRILYCPGNGDSTPRRGFRVG
ncbi:MAG: 1-acyl-sn-glycerol-3-phosphate acyltransferase [Brevinematales bacterium]|nr:1-acyl-sn-glycerol-3-phosphate acyltransferase [Brevinematales bacterium]